MAERPWRPGAECRADLLYTLRPSLGGFRPWITTLSATAWDRASLPISRRPGSPPIDAVSSHPIVGWR